MNGSTKEKVSIGHPVRDACTKFGQQSEILNPEGPLSKRPRNLRQFWKDHPELKIENLEKDFGWIAKQATVFRSIR